MRSLIATQIFDSLFSLTFIFHRGVLSFTQLLVIRSAWCVFRLVNGYGEITRNVFCDCGDFNLLYLI